MVPASRVWSVKSSRRLTDALGQRGESRLKGGQSCSEVLILKDGDTAFNHEISHNVNLQVVQRNPENRSSFGSNNRSIRHAFLLGLGSMDLDGTKVFVNQPAKNVEISSFCSAVNGMHELILLAGNRKGRPQVDVPRSIECHGFFQITVEKCLLERAAQRVATATDLYLSLVLEVVRCRDHFGRPARGTVAADADTAVATVTGAAEYREFPLALEADGRLVEWYHLWWCIGDGRFSGFTLGWERKRLQVFVGCRRILGNTALVCIDCCNPEIGRSVVIHGRREKNARTDLVA